MQLVPAPLASGAPIVVNRIPAEAVVELETTVLLMKLTFKASTIETPAPSQPATLSAMMLLVIVGEYHSSELAGSSATSEPLTFCRRRPPPLPVSAELPMIRLALMTRPGPMPSLRPGAQSTSVMLPHSVPAGLPGGAPSGAPPITMSPPPLAGIVGLRLWLKMMVLCSMSPLKLNPNVATPPPSPLPRLPQTQLYLNL